MPRSCRIQTSIRRSQIGRALLARRRFRSRCEIGAGRIHALRAGDPAQRALLAAHGCDSSSSPSMSASGRGGQPGTYTSTGRKLSTPCTTL